MDDDNNDKKGVEGYVPGMSVHYSATGASTAVNELGMRLMQERTYGKRGEQYLLIKSPPASGKSRALMFVALDKLHNQGVKQAIIAVPERTIGASFRNIKLSGSGFWADWEVVPKWNLCDAPGEDGSKVKAVKSFLASDDKVLICTHATFRFAFDELGVAAFDDRLVAVDEFHHVSIDENNILGGQLGELIARDKVHIVAMTGSYFRGDAAPVLLPEDEARFEVVTYTYYEQLNGYKYLKRLDIGYYFYSGNYVDAISKLIDTDENTIIHIPSVTSRESTKDKIREAESIIYKVGEWTGTDEDTGFHKVVSSPGGIEFSSSNVIAIADLVDDEPGKRNLVVTSLKSSEMQERKDFVKIIIALGMAKEGFDWIWCNHALTVGYRSSLTEVVQIIGRATRDAPGKEYARFTNLIAEPDAGKGEVTEAVNDTLKAIAASLLMQQVLLPKFNFRAKDVDEDRARCEFAEDTGQFDIAIKGLIEPESPEAKRVCENDINEIIADIVQDKPTLEHGVFDDITSPQETTVIQIGKIIRKRYPDLSENDTEAIRQRAVATMNLTQQGRKKAEETGDNSNTAFIDGVKRFAMDVRELDMDLIESINPFGETYSILSKAVNEESLREMEEAIAAKEIKLSEEEARMLTERAVLFKKQTGRAPSIKSNNPWERRMAQGVTFLKNMESKRRRDEQSE